MLLSLLERHFGFHAFRPLQEEIISDALAGRDVIAVLPTGGGKSLCFQLPAASRPGLTLVISPLIALMKDQVDALSAAGIPATFLSSSLDGDEARSRLRGLREGRYRLLYVAPERLLMPGFLASLEGTGVRAIAVDEAHCISEWGHDFRPEYRRLREIREAFPHAPIMALSATATDRVRSDITTSLDLRDPKTYVASFNRPNLLYRVDHKDSALAQILALVRRRHGESGIVYAHSRNTASLLAKRLRAAGESAAAYHAGMEASERNRIQDAFFNGEVRVVCATVAFGMGIHKPDVRFVVHHDLPRDIESYYQETGRAGRDGLPSECLLLFRPGDAVKQAVFLDERLDPEERVRARRRLAELVAFAESGHCRRRALLAYFGETLPDGPCGACDNCLSPREPYDATIQAQKLLSCVLRVQQMSHLSVGLSHVTAVLVGADNEKIRRLGHTSLSTYGIGRDRSRAEWAAIGRELLRLGLLRLSQDRYTVLDVTPRGREALAKRETITLTRPPTRLPTPPERTTSVPPPPSAPKGPSIHSCSADPPCDEALFEKLRQLRRELARTRSVPAYRIFSDATLRELARHHPMDEAAFLRIRGVGEHKLQDLGATFLHAIAEHARSIGILEEDDPGPPSIEVDPAQQPGLPDLAAA